MNTFIPTYAHAHAHTYATLIVFATTQCRSKVYNQPSAHTHAYAETYMAACIIVKITLTVGHILSTRTIQESECEHDQPNEKVERSTICDSLSFGVFFSKAYTNETHLKHRSMT